MPLMPLMPLPDSAPRRIVLTHPEMGVYLGTCLGLGFWSLLDAVGQSEAVSFASESDARDHVRTWDERNDPDSYDYVPVPCGDYATVAELAGAGLGPLLGQMTANLPAAGSG